MKKPIYYYAEFLVKDIHFGPKAGSPEPLDKLPAYRTREEILVYDPKDVKSAAETHAFRQSLVPGQYKFTGKAEPADAINEIINRRRASPIVRLIKRAFSLN